MPTLLLIAMSGVRVKDEELRRAGLTLPGFIERSRVIASLPSLGLLSLAGHTPPHWNVEYLEVDDFDDETRARVLARAFDLVAISSLTARVLDAYDLADSLRAAGAKVVIGGLHVSMLPDEAAAHADCVVRGEGESVWPQLLNDFSRGALKPFYDAFGAPHRLENSRAPRYDLLQIEKYNRLTLQTTRGCPLDCSFCGASRLISSFKKKPLALVRRDLEAILNVWPRPFLELADDNTFADKKWSRELVKMLREYSRPWFTETDISVADDDELLELLAESNCAQLLIGLESPRETSLRGLDRANWKSRRVASYREKIAKIQSHGVSVNGCFVLGLDEDDESVFEAVRDFVRECELSEVQITLLTPFPGTALYRKLRAENRLLKPIFWDECTLFDVTFSPRQMSVQTLRDGFAWLMRELYNDAEVANRKARFRDCRRARRASSQLPTETQK